MTRNTALLVATLVLLVVTETANGTSITNPGKERNHSCFVFRDVNRDGTYDLGDRPFGKLPIRLTRPDKSANIFISNIAGFANLKVSLGNDKGDIREAGHYKIKPFEIDGWYFTTGGEEQEYNIVGNDLVDGRLHPEKPCEHIGLAPTLKVSGKVTPSDGAQIPDYKILAYKAGELSTTLSVDPEGKFAFNAEAGAWKLVVADERETVLHSREIEVSNYPLFLSTIDLGRDNHTPSKSEEAVVSFDDLRGTESLLEIPNGYGGLNWLYWVATHNRLYKGSGYINNTTSGEYIAYNSSGVPASISSAEPFDFVGTNIGAAWPRGEESKVNVKAWRGEEIAHEDQLTISVFGPIFFHANYNQITKVEFSLENYERVVIDDVRYKK